MWREIIYGNYNEDLKSIKDGVGRSYIEITIKITS